MFSDWFSGEFRVWYLQPRNKERVDHVGSFLRMHRYSPVLVRQKLHDWARFVCHLEKKALPLPSSIFDSHVQRYLQKHCSARTPNRRRHIHAAIRIFLEMDGDGKFARRVQSPPRTTNSLYAEVVPGFLTFLRKQQGISEKTVSTYDYRLTVFTHYLERVGVKSWKDVQASVLRTFLTTQLPGRKPTPTRAIVALMWNWCMNSADCMAGGLLYGSSGRDGCWKFDLLCGRNIVLRYGGHTCPLRGHAPADLGVERAD